MRTPDQLAPVNADEQRQFAAQRIGDITDTRRQICSTRRDLTDIRQDGARKQLKKGLVTHEIVILKRWKFAARSEHRHGEQCHLFEEPVETDLEAIGLKLQALQRADTNIPLRSPPRLAMRGETWVEGLPAPSPPPRYHHCIQPTPHAVQHRNALRTLQILEPQHLLR